ncbi:IcmL-like protein [Legionella birminghamensis]|uniref:IcmL-like protein n=1 Tax=Legionella birminghamensis TaxID=28083 RepID=A0A378I5F9_9GAMM|nr:DotI/IcmL family type IV secretion protein [Legionella birminghamensis]KTC73918.1 IcmL-like protein [Legionella birminghamensis]STX30438.1 protein IcmL-like protein [Legionella birminghamensis]
MRAKTCLISFLLCWSVLCQAAEDDTQQAVWANEAIIATYSFNYQNFIERQKQIAKYFTSNGWIAYSTALNESKLPDAVKTNAYYVSAVATLPPTITASGEGHWQASMPILVLYKNPQYQQKQNLNVTITFEQAPAGQGVRGFAITSLTSKVIEPPCECQSKPEHQGQDNK